MEEADDDRLERQDQGTWDDVFHLSVFAGPLGNGEEPEQAASRLFGEHRRVKFFRFAELKVLEDAGFELGASPPEPYHYNVALGTELTEDVIQDFENCLSSERRNPAWKRSS